MQYPIECVCVFAIAGDLEPHILNICVLILFIFFVRWTGSLVLPWQTILMCSVHRRQLARRGSVAVAVAVTLAVALAACLLDLVLLSAQVLRLSGP